MNTKEIYIVTMTDTIGGEYDVKYTGYDKRKAFGMFRSNENAGILIHVEVWKNEERIDIKQI